MIASIIVLAAAAAPGQGVTPIAPPPFSVRAISGKKPVAVSSSRGYVLVRVIPGTLARLVKAVHAASNTIQSENSTAYPQKLNITWSDEERYNTFLIGGDKEFIKYLNYYLYEVPPGMYVYTEFSVNYSSSYNVFAKPALPSNICLCMGTIAFEVRPGRISTVGSLIGVSVDSAPVPVEDPRLPDGQQDLVKFNLVERVPNWTGTVIDRILPISGVFGYSRDKMVPYRKVELPDGQDANPFPWRIRGEQPDKGASQP